MTWEELKEEAKKLFLNEEIGISFIIINETFWFDENGDFGITNEDGSYKIVAHGRTPDQMLAIMKALQ